MRQFLPLFLCLALLAPAQTRRRAPMAAASAANSWPLVSLTVTGNEIYPQAAIVRASGLKVGQTVAKEAFDKARDRLLATGAFETVGFEFGPAKDGKGYNGKFEVAEIRQVYAYRFEELPGTDAELRAWLAQKEPLFGQKIPGTRELLTRFAAELNEYVAQRGFKDKVVGRLVADKPGELAALFRPATPPPAIADARFTGNQVVATPDLIRTFDDIAVGTPYSDVRVRELLDTNIRPMYEAKGRMRVTFAKVEASPAQRGIQGVSLLIHVNEGPEYKFGKIHIATSTVSTEDLYRAAKLKTGEMANFDAVQKAQDAIKKVFHREGYMEMSSSVDRRIDDAKKTVDVDINTQSGPRFRMGKLNIEGLDIIGEPAVRKIWGLKPGAPYDDGYPDTFLDSVRSGGYFDNLGKTRFTADVNRADHTVDVTLYFSGAGPKPDKKKPKERPF